MGTLGPCLRFYSYYVVQSPLRMKKERRGCSGSTLGARVFSSSVSLASNSGCTLMFLPLATKSLKKKKEFSKRNLLRSWRFV